MIHTKPQSYFGLIRNDVIALVPLKSKRILDVGCANGFTGFAAKQLRGDRLVVGVEVSAQAAMEARKRLDKVIEGNIEKLTLDYPDNYFDCILCADVLEHLRNPWLVLQKLHPLLSNDGVLIASIPNIRHIVPILKILLNRFEYEESGICDNTHLRFFTLHTMKKMFQECNYSIEDIKYNYHKTWKHRLMHITTFGLLKQLSIYQHLLVAKKISL